MAVRKITRLLVWSVTIAAVTAGPALSGVGSGSISTRKFVDAFRRQTGIVLVRDAAYSDTSFDVLGLAPSAPTADSDRYGTFSIYVVKRELALARSALLTTPDGKPIKPDANGVFWENAVIATRQFGRNVFLVSPGITAYPRAWKRLNAVISRIVRPVLAPKPVAALPTAIAGAQSGSSSWWPSGLDEALAWLSIPISAGLAGLIFWHAQKHGSKHATGWAVFTFLAFWLAIPIYVIRRWSRGVAA